MQATIMMITWYSNNDVVYHSYQLTSVCLSAVIIAKSCADHHYFETSGKSVKGKEENLSHPEIGSLHRYTYM